MVSNVNKFRKLSDAVSVLFLVLAVCLVFVPDLIYWIFGLTPQSSTDVISRRAGMLFLGLLVFSFLSRSATDSLHRKAFLSGVAVLMAGLISVGIYEWLNATVGPGIWFAITVESIIFIFFAHAWYRN